MRVITCALLFLCYLQTRPAWGGDRACMTMFQNKQFVQASQCFEKLIAKQPKLSGLSEKQRVAVGRRLRNAAVAYRFAANHERRVERAAYYCERAVQLLQYYLKDRLYENRYRKNSALVLQFQLQKKIGYTPLTVVTNHPKAVIQVTGFKFEQRAQARWSQAVRPGPYRIRIEFIGHKQPKLRTIRVVAGKPALVIFRPPGALSPSTRPIVRRRMNPTSRRVTPWRRLVPRPARPPRQHRARRIAAWTLLGVGVAVTVAGAITYGVGRSSEDRRVALYQQAQAQPLLSQTQEIFSLQQQAATLMPVGVSLLSGGGGLVVVGGLLLVVK